jgi:hypothetical protein
MRTAKGGREIGFSEEVKYLGVKVDSKLLFHKHVQEKPAKATAVLVQASRLVGKTWGASPKMVRWIYTAMVRPILSYGALIWVRALHNRTCMAKLRKVQRLACMMITAAYPGSPTAALETLVGANSSC